MTFADGGGTGNAQTESNRSITAFFDRRGDAEQARRDLMAAGIATDDIAIAGGETAPAASSGGLTPNGFWETMKELFIAEADRQSYEEGMRRGGFTIAVRTNDGSIETVIDILDRDGAVDMTSREASWRGEGWTGSTSLPKGEKGEEEMSYAPPSAALAGFGASEADRLPIGPDDAPDVESPGALPKSALAGTSEDVREISTLSPAGGLDGPAPTVEGGVQPASRRDDSHGRTRIRSYIADPGT